MDTPKVQAAQLLAKLVIINTELVKTIEEDWARNNASQEQMEATALAIVDATNAVSTNT
jgi:hypothetical protein